MTAEIYQRDILERIVMPFKPFICKDMVLMNDNARPHVANHVKRYLEEVNLEVLPHPVSSPDMNLIEHVWDHMTRAIRARNPPVGLEIHSRGGMGSNVSKKRQDAHPEHAAAFGRYHACQER